jgi:dipeptidyl aminopeptidase/acylaminoacyl peptidase
LALLLVAGFFAWRRWRPGATLEPLQAAALTTLPGVEQFPSLSPDGNHVVFAWTDPKTGNQDIYVQMIGQDARVRLTTDARSDYNPVWSPDGRWIAFCRSEPPAPIGRRNRELLLIAPLGGPERKLANVQGQDFFPAAGFLAWSADSNSLIVTDSTGEGKPNALFVVSLETGVKRQLTNPQPPALADTSPAVSPDGRSLVFLRRTTWGAGELHLLPLGTDLTAAGEPKRLTPVELRADFPAWMPDGKEIVFSARRSLWRLAITGQNTPTRIPYVGEDGLMPVISRPQPGKPADGGEAVQITPNQGAGGAVESPDGSSIYYHMSSVVSPLWRLPISGGEPVKALDGVVWFNWWLFGNGVYYIDQFGGENRLQYLNFGSGKSTTVARNLGEVSAGLTATPDGRTILFTRVDSSTDDLMLVENFR